MRGSPCQLLQKFLGVGQHVGVGFVVGGGEIDEGFAEDAAHAGGFGFFSDRVFEVIHVGEGGDAGADLLGGGEAGAPADEVFVHVFGFGGEDVFVEPVGEGDVVVQAAK